MVEHNDNCIVNYDDDLLPEQKARVIIDRFLEEAGWTVVARDEYTNAVNAQAVKENLMLGNLEADYLLYLDGKAIGVLEAKREENKLGLEVAEQAQYYGEILPDCVRIDEYHVLLGYVDGDRVAIGHSHR